MPNPDWYPTGTEKSVHKDKQGPHPRVPGDIDSPRGGFTHNPEFWVSSVADGGNGGNWSSTRGEFTDPWFNPGQSGA